MIEKSIRTSGLSANQDVAKDLFPFCTQKGNKLRKNNCSGEDTLHYECTKDEKVSLWLGHHSVQSKAYLQGIMS